MHPGGETVASSRQAARTPGLKPPESASGIVVDPPGIRLPILRDGGDQARTHAHVEGILGATDECLVDHLDCLGNFDVVAQAHSTEFGSGTGFAHAGDCQIGFQEDLLAGLERVVRAEIELEVDMTSRWVRLGVARQGSTHQHI